VRDSFDYLCLAGLVLFAPYRQYVGEGHGEGLFDLGASPYSDVALASEGSALFWLLALASSCLGLRIRMKGLSSPLGGLCGRLAVGVFGGYAGPFLATGLSGLWWRGWHGWPLSQGPTR